MNRRKFLKGCAAGTASLIIGGYSTPSIAIAPPALIAIAGVMVSVAFRRYVVGALMGWLARLFPSLFASELRKYLMAVAVTLGMSEAKAAVIAEKAEKKGATDLARNGHERITNIEITNRTSRPLELAQLHLLLVNLETNTVELRSQASWGLVVYEDASLKRQIVCNRFPSRGMKCWHLADSKRTLAVSEPFMVV